MSIAWFGTLASLGYSALGDPFSGEVYWGYINAMSIDPAIETRSDAVTASLEPAKNLHVVTDATGIGSRERLESLSIPLVASNPNVGENLQDQA